MQIVLSIELHDNILDLFQVDMIQQGCLFLRKPEFIMLIIGRNQINDTAALIRLFTGYNIAKVCLCLKCELIFGENQTNCFQIIDYRIDGYEHLIRQRILCEIGVGIQHLDNDVVDSLVGRIQLLFLFINQHILQQCPCLSLFDLQGIALRAFHDDLSIKAG